MLKDEGWWGRDKDLVEISVRVEEEEEEEDTPD